MMDWVVVSTIAAPILSLFVGAWLDRQLEAKAKLIAFYGHVSAFKVRPDGADAFDVFTHSVVIRNAGRRPATDVRVSHGVFPPNVTVFPPIEYRTVKIPDGAVDLVIPILVPGQQITISYLYYPPVLYSQVNTSVRSTDGFAQIVNVLPTVPPATWLRRARIVLTVVGAIATAYLGYEALLRLWKVAG
jgi:hypothetical protein